MATEEKPAEPTQAQEQDINPWSVDGGQDAAGNVVAIDYDALIRHVQLPFYPRAEHEMLIGFCIIGNGVRSLSTMRF